MAKKSASKTVTCESCKTKSSIGAPADDAWYGVTTIDDDGHELLVECVTWLCDQCDTTNHIYRDITVEEAEPDA